MTARVIVALGVLLAVSCSTTPRPNYVWASDPRVAKTHADFQRDTYECERDMRMARPGFSGQGSRDVASGGELAYLMLFGARSFGNAKDDQAAYDFYKRCMEVRNWWLTTREVVAERKRYAQESPNCKNPEWSAKNAEYCRPPSIVIGSPGL